MARIRVFNWAGDALAELDSISTKRSWVINDYGKCTFSVPLVNATTKEVYFRYGNLLLIEGDGLPAWVGVIDTPRSWTSGRIEINAYTAEKILEWRAMPLRSITGNAGALFNTILGYAAGTGGTPIRIGAVFADSVSREEELSDDALTHINRIATRAGNEFYIEPRVSTSGKLSLIANYVRKIGVDSPVTITDDHVEFTQILREQGDLINIVNGVGDATTAGTRPIITKRDERSVSLYGARSKNVVFWGNRQDATLDGNTVTELRESKQAQRVYSLTLANYGNIFASMKLGNTYKLFLSSAGFWNNTVGVNERIRVTGMRYDDATNKLTLNVKTVNL